ncbi:MAG: hypothetical protein JOZ49_21130 [Mycolicibacterium sp.]|nr:hypothetical protein [Mycolicibacterium sp.]
MVTTVIVLPIVLPLVIKGLTVDNWALARTLLQQMILPLAIGMLLLQFAEGVAAAFQPWVARISNIALYVLIVAIVIGYLPAMTDPGLWSGVGVGMVVLLLAFFLGWTIGDGHDHLQDVGGLATAQRGTAAALIVAEHNFIDPRVLVVITLTNTLGVVMLIAAAKLLSRENSFDFLIPAAADVPGAAETTTNEDR